LVNDDLLLDLGPDIMTGSQVHGYSLVNVRYCLQTHPHADHLDLSHLLSRSREYGTVGTPCLHFYASSESLQRAAQTFERDLEGYGLLTKEAEKRLNLKIHTIEAFKPFTFGRYRAIAFPANHAPIMGAMLYVIEAEGRSVFYGTDTAILLEPTWQAFHELHMRFDLVILDHTYGPNQEGSDHLSAHQFIDHIARMRREGLMTRSGRAFATHIAHEGNPAHPELAVFAEQHGYEVAYDGLILEI
jgi:phosphoribosyl 1,2-cyclic phosphodiesterase